MQNVNRRNLVVPTSIAIFASLLAIGAYFMPFESHSWSSWKMAYGYVIGGAFISGPIVFVVETASSVGGIVVLLSLALSRWPRLVVSLTNVYFFAWLGFYIAYLVTFFGLPSLNFTSIWLLLTYTLLPVIICTWILLTLRGWKRQSINGILFFLAFLFLADCILEIVFVLLEDQMLLNYGAVVSTVAAVLIMIAFAWRIDINRLCKQFAVK